MSRIGMGFAVVLLSLAAAPLHAVTLSLRPTGASTGTPLTLELETEGSFEIVLDLEDGESSEFVTLFLDTSGDAAAVEVFDLQSDLPAPAEFNRVPPFDEELPFPAGAGASVDDYALLLIDANLTGPGEFVLERVLVRGRTVGNLSVRFAAGELTPEISDVNSALLEAIVSSTPQVIRVRAATTGGGPRPAVRMCGAGGAMAVLLSVIGLRTFSQRIRRQG